MSGDNEEVEVIVKQQLFGRRQNYSRRNQMEERLNKEWSSAGFLAKVKQGYEFCDDKEARVISRACSNCFGSNYECQIDADLKNLGVSNCLKCPKTISSRSRWLRHIDTCLARLWQTSKSSFDYMISFTPQHVVEDLKQRISISSNEEKSALLCARSLCVGVNTGGPWSLLIYRCTGWILSIILRSCCSAICVHEGEISLLERIHQTDLPIIYVSASKSWCDPYILNFAMLSHGLRLPYFFTKSAHRSFSKTIGGISVDHRVSKKITRNIKQEVFISWLRTALSNHNSIVITPESKRSRTGRFSLELYSVEIMKVVLDLYLDNVLEDVYIVPVNVSYDKLPEFCNPHEYFIEIKGFCHLLRQLWKCFKSKLGLIRIDFGQPFSIRDYVRSVKKTHKFKRQVDCKDSFVPEYYTKILFASEMSFEGPNTFPSSCSLSSLYDLCPPAEYSSLDDDVVLDSLVIHSAYASFSSQSLTAANLVAFLLLKKFRNGVLMPTLLTEFEALQKGLLLKGRDLAFCGTMNDSLTHGVSCLKDITVLRKNSANNDLHIQPDLNLDSLQRLEYYASPVLSCFAMDCLISSAICSMEYLNLQLFYGMDLDIKIKDDSLIPQIQKMYSIFASMFYLHPPCLTSTGAIRKGLESMQKDMQIIEYVINSDNRQRDAYAFDPDDPDEIYDSRYPEPDKNENFFTPDEYKITTNAHIVDTIRFFNRLLIPYLEIYAEVGSQLLSLIDNKGQRLTDFVNTTLQELTKTFSIKYYGEYLSKENIRWILFNFEERHVIVIKVNVKTKDSFLYLQKEYSNAAAIHGMVKEALSLISC